MFQKSGRRDRARTRVTVLLLQTPDRQGAFHLISSPDLHFQITGRRQLYSRFWKNQCEGGDSNARTPARQGPQPCAFDLARQPSRSYLINNALMNKISCSSLVVQGCSSSGLLWDLCVSMGCGAHIPCGDVFKHRSVGAGVAHTSSYRMCLNTVPLEPVWRTPFLGKGVSQPHGAYGRGRSHLFFSASPLNHMYIYRHPPHSLVCGWRSSTNSQTRHRRAEW